MGNDPGFPQRRSIRLREFDYRTPGCYVVTICTEHRDRLFGEIVDGEMVPSPAGAMVQQIWDEIPSFYADVDIDAFAVMPNHVHGIVVLPSIDRDLFPTDHIYPANPVGATPCGCPLPPSDQSEDGAHLADQLSSNTSGDHDDVGGQHGQPQGVAPTNAARSTETDGERLSLSDVVHRFKTLTTYRYGLGAKTEGWPRYQGRLWQRNYYERVVRNEAELTKFRTYIENNPRRWFEDPYRGD